MAIVKDYNFDPSKGLRQKDKQFMDGVIEPAIKKGILMLLVEGEEPYTPKTMDDYNRFNTIHRGKGRTVLMVLKKQ